MYSLCASYPCGSASMWTCTHSGRLAISRGPSLEGQLRPFEKAQVSRGSARMGGHPFRKAVVSKVSLMGSPSPLEGLKLRGVPHSWSRVVSERPQSPKAAALQSLWLLMGAATIELSRMGGMIDKALKLTSGFLQQCGEAIAPQPPFTQTNCL